MKTPCDECGKALPVVAKPKPGRRRKYCSKACGVKAWKRANHNRKYQPRTHGAKSLLKLAVAAKTKLVKSSHPCESCGGSIRQQGAGRRRRFCTDSCKLLAQASANSEARTGRVDPTAGTSYFSGLVRTFKVGGTA